MTDNNRKDTQDIESALENAGILIDKRFLHFAFSSLGQKAEVRLANGNKTSGTFYTADLDYGAIALKNYKDENNKNIPAQLIESKDFVHILISDVEEPPLKNKAAFAIKTDEEISKKKFLSNRELVKWSAEDNFFSGGNLEGNIEELQKAEKNWDQFNINQTKFGIKSDYSDDHYTTRLDMGMVDPKILEKAKRVENEILNMKTDSRHIAEERGLAELQEEDEDEEALYSSVIREDKKAAYKGKGEKADPNIDPKFATKFTGAAPPRFTNSKLKKQDSEPGASKPIELKTDAVPFEMNTSTSEKLQPQVSKAPVVEKPQVETKVEEAPKKEEKPVEPQVVPKEEPKRVLSPGKKLPLGKENSNQKPAEEKKRVRPEPRKLDRSMISDSAILKWKIKTGEKELVKSTQTFKDYILDNWEKKTNIPDPANFDSDWKIQKAKQENMKLDITSGGSTPANRIGLKTSKSNSLNPGTNSFTASSFQKPEMIPPMYNAVPIPQAQPYMQPQMMGYGGYPTPPYQQYGKQMYPPQPYGFYNPGMPDPMNNPMAYGGYQQKPNNNFRGGSGPKRGGGPK